MREWIIDHVIDDDRVTEWVVIGALAILAGMLLFVVIAGLVCLAGAIT